MLRWLKQLNFIFSWRDLKYLKNYSSKMLYEHTVRKSVQEKNNCPKSNMITFKFWENQNISLIRCSVSTNVHF